jgi:hypothetical protein
VARCLSGRRLVVAGAARTGFAAPGLPASGAAGCGLPRRRLPVTGRRRGLSAGAAPPGTVANLLVLGPVYRAACRRPGMPVRVRRAGWAAVRGPAGLAGLRQLRRSGPAAGLAGVVRPGAADGLPAGVRGGRQCGSRRPARGRWTGRLAARCRRGRRSPTGTRVRPPPGVPARRMWIVAGGCGGRGGVDAARALGRRPPFGRRFRHRLARVALAGRDDRPGVGGRVCPGRRGLTAPVGERVVPQRATSPRPMAGPPMPRRRQRSRSRRSLTGHLVEFSAGQLRCTGWRHPAIAKAVAEGG